MKRLVKLVVLACVLGFLFHVFFPSMTFRYRLVLEATDGAKQVTGSTVLSVTYTKNIPLLGANSNVITHVDGEATTLSLSGGRAILMLLARGGEGRSYPGDIVAEVFKLQTWALLSKPFVRTPAIDGSRQLPIELLPLIAILDNTQRPTSARYVPVLQFPARVDSDVSITGVRIEIIDDGIWPLTTFGVTGTQPTKGIELALPWVDSREARSAFWKSIIASGYSRPDNVVIIEIFKRKGLFPD